MVTFQDMSEVKKYKIGAYTFVLADLTFQQIRKANPFEQKLRSAMKPVKLSEAAKEVGELTEVDINNVNEFLLTLESNMYSDDMLEFLATILTIEGNVWEPDDIAKHKDVMQYITEGTLQTVLSDFFSRNNRGKSSKGNGTPA